MPRLNLFIADTDEWYMESLARFASNKFASAFHINTFTQIHSLMEYLASSGYRNDILLISPDLYSNELEVFDISVIIFLSDGKPPLCPGKSLWIDKYRPAEKILGDIVSLYMDTVPGAAVPGYNDKRVPVISVYSVVGGSGKSVTAATLSSLYAGMGLETLFLSLESISSTNFFIGSEGINEHGFSRLLYFIKENKKNAAAKISTFKSTDPRLGISYFETSYSCFELDEMTGEDIERLIMELKVSGQFDIIVMDMDSSLNRRNMSVLINSDCILMLLIQDALAMHKLKAFGAEIKKFTPGNEKTVYEKIIPVINKYSGDLISKPVYFDGSPVNDKIPYIQDIMAYSGRAGGNPCSIMEKYLDRLARNIMEKIDYTPSEVTARWTLPGLLRK